MNNLDVTPYTILWIEDQLFDLGDGLEVLKECLEESLARPVEFINVLTVDEAEAKLQEHRETPPDVILLDMMLPRNNAAAEAEPPRIDLNAGFGIWHRLRQQEVWGEAMSQVPVVVITARGNPSFRSQMEQPGGPTWLCKPVGPVEMAKCIIGLAGRH